jgi:signal transduction histidine kinase
VSITRPSIRGRRFLGASAGDLILAGSLALVGELDVLLSSQWRGPVVVNAIVVPSMAGALVWRRRAPLLALSAVVGGIAALSLAFGGSETWSSVFITLVAVYSVAAHGSNPLGAVGVIVVGVAVHDLRDSQIQSFGDAVWSSTLVGLAFLVGRAAGTRQQRVRALERRAENFEREQQERAAAAAADERARIARELHDIVSHSLGVLVLQAGAAEQVLERDPKRAREVLRSIRATGHEAIGEMGTLLGLIRGDEEHSREPQPSLADLARLIATMRDAGLRADLQVEGAQRALPAALELSAFRIVQEGLTNALKHAGPANVAVILRYGERELEVEVVDDGNGSGNGQGGRRGLVGVGERVAVFGGRLEAGSRPCGGWILRAILPLTR